MPAPLLILSVGAGKVWLTGLMLQGSGQCVDCTCQRRFLNNPWLVLPRRPFP